MEGEEKSDGKSREYGTQLGNSTNFPRDTGNFLRASTGIFSPALLSNHPFRARPATYVQPFSKRRRRVDCCGLDTRSRVAFFRGCGVSSDEAVSTSLPLEKMERVASTRRFSHPFTVISPDKRFFARTYVRIYIRGSRRCRGRGGGRKAREENDGNRFVVGKLDLREPLDAGFPLVLIF